jgi:hypothetical protein
MELVVLNLQNVKLLELILLLVYPKSVMCLLERVVLLKLVAMMQILVLLILVALMVSAHMLANAPSLPMPASPALVMPQPELVNLLRWSVLNQVVVLNRHVIQSRGAFLL